MHRLLKINQGNLTEGEGSVRLTFCVPTSLGQLLLKMNILFTFMRWLTVLSLPDKAVSISWINILYAYCHMCYNCQYVRNINGKHTMHSTNLSLQRVALKK